MKEKIIAVLEEMLSVSDEWGGTKLAGSQWGYNVLVAGIEDAAQKIVEEFANSQPTTQGTKPCANCISSDSIGEPSISSFSHCHLCKHSHKDYFESTTSKYLVKDIENHI